MKYTVNYTNPKSTTVENFNTTEKIGACLLVILLVTFYILSFQFLLNRY